MLGGSAKLSAGTTPGGTELALKFEGVFGFRGSGP